MEKEIKSKITYCRNIISLMYDINAARTVAYDDDLTKIEEGLRKDPKSPKLLEELNKFIKRLEPAIPGHNPSKIPFEK